MAPPQATSLIATHHMITLPLFATLALFGMWGIALTNRRHFPRLQSAAPALPADATPGVSILIPVRNEQHNIGETIRHLRSQTYANFEVLVLDDQSEDGTVAEAQRAALDDEGLGDSRVRVLRGSPKPEAWVGKTWACHQLAQAARYDLLVFTDADVRWQPGALAAVAQELQRPHVDVLTVWPTQITISWAERLVVPLMGMVVMGYMPVRLFNDTDWPGTGAANGQCLAFTRAAYARCGGHAAVRNSVLEDMMLAQHCKQQRMRLRMVDGSGLLSCRMYRNRREVVDGYAKNILAGHGQSVALLLLSTLAHLLIFVMPWLWLARGRRRAAGAAWGWPAWPAALIAAGVGLRAFTARLTGQRARDAAFLPLSVLLMTGIALRSIWWQLRYGGPKWKGRTIRTGRKVVRGA